MAIKFRHPHTAESDRGNNRSTASKFSLFHGCPIQVLGAITSQRSRMALYSFWGSGRDSRSRAFSWQRSGFVVPTIAVCTPGTLKTKRNARSEERRVGKDGRARCEMAPEKVEEE